MVLSTIEGRLSKQNSVVCFVEIRHPWGGGGGGTETGDSAQHFDTPVRTVAVRGGQSVIVPSSPEARDCRSPWLASPLLAVAQ